MTDLDAVLDRGNLYRAWQRVWENGGCRGVDGVTVGAFRDRLEWELDSIQGSLLGRCYRPLPLMAFPVPKGGGGGERWLAVPTVRDRVVQSAVYLMTRDVFEAEFEDCSYAYRRGRSVRQALERIRALRDSGHRWVVDADIVGFFDRIPHGPLLDRVAALLEDPDLRELFALWVGAEIYDGASLARPERGIPQGSVVSPMLANLYLDPLDEDLAAAGLAAVRYADDFVLLCRDEAAAGEALEVTDELLEGLELDLHRGKSEVRSFDQGFRFLGAMFVGDGVFLPLRGSRVGGQAAPRLPEPLGLRRYLELAGVRDREAAQERAARAAGPEGG